MKEKITRQIWKPVGTLAEAEAFAEKSAIRQTLYCGTLLEDYIAVTKTGWIFNLAWDEKNKQGRKGHAVYLFEAEEDAREWAGSARIPEGRKGVVFQVKVNVLNPAYLEPGAAQIMTTFGDRSLVDQLKLNDHDSATFWWTGRNGKEVLVFDPQNVMIIADAATIVWPPTAQNLPISQV